MTECQNCSYYWQDVDDDFPCCQFSKNNPYDDKAPCEYETGGDEDIDDYGY